MKHDEDDYGQMVIDHTSSTDGQGQIQNINGNIELIGEGDLQNQDEDIEMSNFLDDDFKDDPAMMQTDQSDSILDENDVSNLIYELINFRTKR